MSVIVARKATDILDDIIADIHEKNHHLRVWSLVISIYGDAVIPRGEKFSLRGLHAILERMKIGSGAIRTAMSRLTNDGSMVRLREKGNSYYKLSPAMTSITVQASKKIFSNYDDGDKWQGAWQLATVKRQDLTDDLIDELQGAGFIRLHLHLFIRFIGKNEQLPDIPQLMFFHADANADADNKAQILAWVKKQHKSSELYDTLVTQFQTLHEALQRRDELTALDALVARILLIHAWRKAVLIDDCYHPANPFYYQAYQLTQSFYHLLWEASEQWLDDFSGIGMIKKNSTLVRFGKDLSHGRK